MPGRLRLSFAPLVQQRIGGSVDTSQIESTRDASVEAVRGVVDRLAAEVWQLSEVSLQEVESSKAHLRELEEAGFTIVSGAAGVPTAFVAEWTSGDGGPAIGFLPEYDALPGLGNEAVPRREPRADGVTNGHGCGHNLLGAALTGAAIAARQAAETLDLAGTIRVYGCAAEETEGAKIYMARDGLFDDLDACLHWHPAPIAAVANVRLASVNLIKIEFHGRTAHAGLEPWKGRSALHAMELAAHGLNLMREHIEPTARVQYIFEASGDAPNVVPDYARMFLVLRDIDRVRVVATTEWAREVAEGAARATQTTADFTVYAGMHDLLPNTPLAERMQRHLEQVGTPAWDADEQAFATECQRELAITEAGLATVVMPLPDEPSLGGATDVAEASWITPTMGITMPTMPLGVPLHTWPVTACAGMSIGLKGAHAAADVLARTALDLLTDDQLRTDASADLDRRRGDYRHVSLLPPEQRHPIDLPDWLITDGSAEAIRTLEHAS
jgi:aminobenzoyl-glutamate utilization protein B